VVQGAVDELVVCAALIRPDGYIAWAADAFEHDDEERLHAALQRWFGVADQPNVKLCANSA
jgi:hypothetical protein